MPVGIYGPVIFRADIFLPKNMKRETVPEWAEHKIINQMTIPQFTGLQPGVFRCEITFNKRHTLSFEAGLALLESIAKAGDNYPLVIGPELIGGFDYPNYFISKISADYGVTDNFGIGLHSTVTVEWKQYRDSIASNSGGLLGNFGSILGDVSSAISSAVGAITGNIGASVGASIGPVSVGASIGG